MRPADPRPRTNTWRRRLAGVAAAAALTLSLADPCPCPLPGPAPPEGSDHGCCTGTEGIGAADAACCPTIPRAQTGSTVVTVTAPVATPVAWAATDLTPPAVSGMPRTPASAVHPPPLRALRV